MFGFVYVSFLCVVTVVLIYSNNCDIWILLTNNNCEGLFGSFTPSVKAKGEGGGGELLWYWNWRYHIWWQRCCWTTAVKREATRSPVVTWPGGGC